MCKYLAYLCLMAILNCAVVCKQLAGSEQYYNIKRMIIDWIDWMANMSKGVKGDSSFEICKLSKACAMLLIIFIDSLNNLQS